jgi:Lrp/AsnC family transcriptional regulator, leucine-responsive regulatory protein
MLESKVLATFIFRFNGFTEERMRNKRKDLDSIDWKILGELQADARVSTAELGRRVALSPPAIVERIAKLLDHGVVSGFHAHVEPSSVGLPITAMIRMSVVGDILPRLSILLQSLPEVVECYRGTGSDSFIMKVCVESVEHLEHLIDRLTPFGMTSTSIVLSTVVARRAFDPTMRDWKARLKAGRRGPVAR